MALEWGKSTNEIILQFEIQPELECFTKIELDFFFWRKREDLSLGLLDPILEDEVMLVVELADNLDWSRLLVEHVLLSICVTFVFNLVCDVGDKSTNEIILQFEILKGRTGMIYKD